MRAPARLPFPCPSRQTWRLTSPGASGFDTGPLKTGAPSTHRLAVAEGFPRDGFPESHTQNTDQSSQPQGNEGPEEHFLTPGLSQVRLKLVVDNNEEDCKFLGAGKVSVLLFFSARSLPQVQCLTFDFQTVDNSRDQRLEELTASTWSHFL